MPARVIPWMAQPPCEPGIYLLTSSRTSPSGELEVKAGRALDIAARFRNHAHEVAYREQRLADGGYYRLIGARIVRDVKRHREIERELLSALRAVGRLASGPTGWFHTREWLWVRPAELVAVIRGAT